MANNINEVSTLATAWTITLWANGEYFKFRNTAIGARASACIVTNLDATVELYVRFTEDADAPANHYTLTAGQSLNLDFRKEGTQNFIVTWTAWKKFTYLVM